MDTQLSDIRALFNRLNSDGHIVPFNSTLRCFCILELKSLPQAIPELAHSAKLRQEYCSDYSTGAQMNAHCR